MSENIFCLLIDKIRSYDNNLYVVGEYMSTESKQAYYKPSVLA